MNEFESVFDPRRREGTPIPLDEVVADLKRAMLALNGEGDLRDAGTLAMVRLRRVIEAYDMQEQVERLWMMCNWAMHIELSRSPLIFDWFRQISTALYASKEHQFTQWYIWKEVMPMASVGLRLPEIKDDVQTLLARVGTAKLGKVRFDWIRFRTAMLHAVAGPPMGLLPGAEGLKGEAKKYAAWLAEFPVDYRISKIEAVSVFVEKGYFTMHLHVKGDIPPMYAPVVDTGLEDRCKS